MTGNIQSRRIAPKDAACGRCRGIAGVGRRTNQNKCRTKKYPHFVLFSCRRFVEDSIFIWCHVQIICFFWLLKITRIELFFSWSNPCAVLQEKIGRQGAFSWRSTAAACPEKFASNVPARWKGRTIR